MSVSPFTCVGQNLRLDSGRVAFAPWSVPRLVCDVKAASGADGLLAAATVLPGKLLIDTAAAWRNESPVDHMVIIRVTRRYKTWITCNPNAVQFRDRWSWAIDDEPAEPVTSGIFNGQTGSAGDVGTNTVAEPNGGKFWHLMGTSSVDEWVGPLQPDSELLVAYRCYVWTPPPFSNNANLNNPEHRANAGWVRIQLIAMPQQGDLVTEWGYRV